MAIGKVNTGGGRRLRELVLKTEDELNLVVRNAGNFIPNLNIVFEEREIIKQGDYLLILGFQTLRCYSISQRRTLWNYMFSTSNAHDENVKHIAANDNFVIIAYGVYLSKLNIATGTMISIYPNTEAANFSYPLIIDDEVYVLSSNRGLVKLNSDLSAVVFNVTGFEYGSGIYNVGDVIYGVAGVQIAEYSLTTSTLTRKTTTPSLPTTPGSNFRGIEVTKDGNYVYASSATTLIVYNLQGSSYRRLWENNTFYGLHTRRIEETKEGNLLVASRYASSGSSNTLTANVCDIRNGNVIATTINHDVSIFSNVTSMINFEGNFICLSAQASYLLVKDRVFVRI